MRSDADRHGHFAAGVFHAGTDLVPLVAQNVAAEFGVTGARHTRHDAVAVDTKAELLDRPAPAVDAAAAAERDPFPNAQKQVHAVITQIVRHQVYDFIEQVIDIEDRDDCPRNLDHRVDALGLAALGVVGFGLLQRQRELSGERFQHEDVVVAEGVRAIALHVQHAHDVFLHGQRDRDLAAGGVERPNRQEAFIGADVGDVRCFFVCRRPADQPLAGFQDQPVGLELLVAAGFELERVSFGVADEDAHRIIAECVTDQRHDLAEQVRHRLDRGDLPRHAVDQAQLARALLRGLEHLRVADRG